MNKYIIIDCRMRALEKNLLKNLGFNLVEIQKSYETYPEISSHVDIFTCKINTTLVVEKSQYNYIKNRIKHTKTKIIERRKFYWKIISRRCKI